MEEIQVQVPHNFHPRSYQLPLLDAFDRGYKRLFVLWHRRAGKDLCLWNLMIREAVERVGLYYYLLPTYTQAKKIIWDGITHDGLKFIDFIPRDLIDNKNGTELKIELWNGSIIQLIGTDNYDAIRGTNPIGCVFSEYAYQNPMAWEVIKPILTVNKGWALFNTTPNGKNHSYEMDYMARENPDWFTQSLDILATGVLSVEDMDKERLEGMSEEMIAQEYFCSYDVGRQGAYYADQVNESRENDRICGVPEEKNLKTDLWLDLGKNDSTSIIMQQLVGLELHLIDFIEDSGKDIDFYIKTLRERNYSYGVMHLPHDAFHKRLESAKTIAEQFEEGGFKVERVPHASIQNGIQQVRKIFPRVYFDKDKCSLLVRALENYHKEYDEVGKVFKKTPKHDWSSHAADAMRYLAIGFEKEDKNTEKEAELARRAFITQGRDKVMKEQDKAAQRAVRNFISG
tara:strand:+ start:23036 stop:24403 length:1368 start_codon:yes stop_codon:yes gene_type:complete